MILSKTQKWNDWKVKSLLHARIWLTCDCWEPLPLAGTTVVWARVNASLRNVARNNSTPSWLESKFTWLHDFPAPWGDLVARIKIPHALTSHVSRFGNQYGADSFQAYFRLLNYVLSRWGAHPYHMGENPYTWMVFLQRQCGANGSECWVPQKIMGTEEESRESIRLCRL